MRAPPSASNAGLLARWGRFAARRRGWVVLAWVATLVAVVVLWRVAGGTMASSFTVPGTESQRAFNLLRDRFPQRSGDSATLVFKSPDGITDPEVRARVESVLAEAQRLPGVIAIASPYQPGGGGAISANGQVAYATVQYGVRSSSLSKSDVDALFSLVDHAGDSRLTVEAGGQVVEGHEQDIGGRSEAIGLVAAVFILLVAFGSVVAMGLPLVTALVGLGASFALIGLAARVLNLPIFATSFASMIGLGVGIDYALLVVTRFREALSRGYDVTESVAQAVSTAGRSVAFAGTVVVIAMLGMLAIGIPFVGALGIAGAVVVAVAVLVALTLLPALLAFAGPRIDRWRLPVLHATDTGDARSVWYRLSRLIQRRPVVSLLLSLVLVLVLAVPALSAHLGAADAGNNPASLHSRRAYDLLAEGFGPGFNGPLTVVFDLSAANGDARQSLERARTAVAGWPGIAGVTAPIMNQRGDAAIMTAFPRFAPQDSATQQLVHDLRRHALPNGLAGSGVRAYVTGPTAAYIDISDRISGRLPLFFGAVIGLSFILLMTVFRSAVIALKAAVMNLLSIGAAYGVVTAIFQWGWLSGVVGVKPGPIESFLPMMLFAILFGLSMDYEVFLISRVREEYVHGRNTSESVARGLAVTARVITAAAAIMVVVFLSFALAPTRVIKEFGVGLAAAIFVDATLVRLFLVPSTMELLGNASWWLPRWLGRLLPHLDVEGTPAHEPEPVAAD